MVDWGLGVKAGATLTRNHAIRLTAACHVIADNLQKGRHAMLRVMLVFTLAHFALGHDNVVKELLHWTRAKLAVMYVYRRVNRNRSLHRLCELLISADVPESYPRTFHFRKSVVYIKNCLRRDPWYIGSTTLNVYEHDLNRLSKFRQRCRQRFACFEPAMHWDFGQQHRLLERYDRYCFSFGHHGLGFVLKGATLAFRLLYRLGSEGIFNSIIRPEYSEPSSPRSLFLTYC